MKKEIKQKRKQIIKEFYNKRQKEFEINKRNEKTKEIESSFSYTFPSEYTISYSGASFNYSVNSNRVIVSNETRE